MEGVEDGDRTLCAKKQVGRDETEGVVLCCRSGRPASSFFLREGRRCQEGFGAGYLKVRCGGEREGRDGKGGGGVEVGWGEVGRDVVKQDESCGVLKIGVLKGLKEGGEEGEKLKTVEGDGAK